MVIFASGSIFLINLADNRVASNNPTFCCQNPHLSVLNSLIINSSAASHSDMTPLYFITLTLIVNSNILSSSAFVNPPLYIESGTSPFQTKLLRPETHMILLCKFYDLVCLCPVVRYAVRNLPGVQLSLNGFPIAKNIFPVLCRQFFKNYPIIQILGNGYQVCVFNSVNKVWVVDLINIIRA